MLQTRAVACIPLLLTNNVPSTERVEPSSDEVQKVYEPPTETRKFPVNVAAKLVFGVPGTRAAQATAVSAGWKFIVEIYADPMSCRVAKTGMPTMPEPTPPKVMPELGVYTFIKKPLAACAECNHVSRKSVSSFDTDAARGSRERKGSHLPDRLL